MKEIFGRFFAILLIGLLLVKVSAFHVYEHHDASESSNNPCELCVLTLDGQQTEGVFPAFMVVEYAPVPPSSQPTMVYWGERDTKTFQRGTLFCRPPPIV